MSDRCGNPELPHEDTGAEIGERRDRHALTAGIHALDRFDRDRQDVREDLP
jgi:hypothetical protein